MGIEACLGRDAVPWHPLHSADSDFHLKEVALVGINADSLPHGLLCGVAKVDSRATPASMTFLEAFFQNEWTDRRAGSVVERPDFMMSSLVQFSTNGLSFINLLQAFGKAGASHLQCLESAFLGLCASSSLSSAFGETSTSTDRANGSRIPASLESIAKFKNAAGKAKAQP
eukprot:CAMPEP_0197651626 /NCGR_PEP_ID=MMETSP1338-20131121/33373_1 /TAXON_ID=43686 ORGANISM="Pelagodinium beii, Strain RCC1491" /NCGR_SAMPLE_ID=MMETSP1338 /ASSEMBLY_ACC=CAM_ASM_000754 /LENGTH=170 /DNA_ID=CAMNT_0043226315 /DNA_START=278 /DNA_END=791 /DNA_ORIENTATION=-